MNGKYLPNFNEKLIFNDNTKNLRSKEILFVPRELTKFGSHRLSIFLPKFVNAVLKHSYQLNFVLLFNCVIFKCFLINNLFILFDNFLKDTTLSDFLS